MEEITQKKASKKTGLKIFILLLFVLLISVIGIYTWFMIGSVQARMSLAPRSGVSIDSNLVKLMKEKSWVESRLKMASGDSIGLSIDLQEQLIQLELKGVVLMKSPIKEFTTSGIFKQMNSQAYFDTFGSPLSVLSLESTIPKNPFKVVQAPKSEAEADSLAMKKDSVLRGDIFWTIKLDRDIELNIHGIDSISSAKVNYRLDKDFLFRRRVRNIYNSIHAILNNQKPEYTPEILIGIPKNEAKAILHALPHNAMVTIKI